MVTHNILLTRGHQKTPSVSRLTGLTNVKSDLQASIEQLDAIQKGSRTKYAERTIYQITKAISELDKLISAVK